VLAHATFNFFITGVSRGFSHELVRHGVGIAISQRSTRYVDEDASPWIEHPLLTQYIEQTRDTTVRIAFESSANQCRDTYRLIVRRLEKHLLERGVDPTTARKQARGAARGVLGNALETELFWSGNVRALRWVVSQRASPGADAEIRAFGIALLRLMQAELPVYFVDYVTEPSPDGLGETAQSLNPKI
jgi:thymidylate synthase (FAD)